MDYQVRGGSFYVCFYACHLLNKLPEYLKLKLLNCHLIKKTGLKQDCLLWCSNKYTLAYINTFESASIHVVAYDFVVY